MKRVWPAAMLLGVSMLAILGFAAGGVQTEFVAPNGVRYRVRKMGVDPVTGEEMWSSEIFTADCQWCDKNCRKTLSGYEFVAGLTLLPYLQAVKAAKAAALRCEEP